jgi:lipopolysaccharide export system protein LptC
MTVPAAPRLRLKCPKRRLGVRMLQLALPALAGAVTLGLAAQATVRALATRTGPATAAEPLRLDNPRFSGRMNDGRTFLITAVSAVRDQADTEKLTLQSPRLIRGAGTPQASEMSARTGEYRQDASTLLLNGDVRIADGGARIASQQALIDTRTGDLLQGGPVVGDNAEGAIRAGGYSVTDKGDRVVFKGGVRARLDAR